jgi:hypothetical protein
LRVCIGDNEFDPVQSGFDHIIDRVSARAADAYDDDTGL